MHLITGLNGILSSALIQTFLESAQEISVLTRGCDNPKQYPFCVIEADLLDLEQTSRCLEDLKIDGIIHSAAAMHGVAISQFDNAGNYLNSVMTRNLLKSLEGNLPERFVLVSSVDVYGPEAYQNPANESSELNPVTDYGKSKLESEYLVEQWSETHKLSSLILRLTQIFGPNDRTHKFIPSVIRNIKSDQPVDLFGEGEDLRDYIFSRDAARLVLDLYEKNAEGVYNLATGTSRTLREVLNKIIFISGKKIEVRYKTRNRKRLDYRFDNSKLTSFLPDFKFSDFDKALRETYDLIF